jgi:hypothetical protein
MKLELRDLLPVHSQTTYLSVKVGEISALEKRIVAEADPGNDVASAESHLLYFGEELINRTVEN